MQIIDMVKTGKKIRQLRIDAGMTIRDVQDACGGITATAVCKWQAGQALPSLDNLAILAHIWGVKMDDIIVCRRTA